MRPGKIEIIKLEKLFFIDNPVELCQLPYPGHPRGCHNVGKPNCPPNAPKLCDKYKLMEQRYFVVYPFDIAAQKARMKKLHPDWSDKKCACCYYWQKGVRKELKFACNNFRQEIGLRDFDYELIPEAMGLDVFETALHHGIPIERNPQGILYKIAFVGVLR